MMIKRGISVDHATIHCLTVHYARLLLEQFDQR
jgi:transposase-like protein